MVCAVALPLTVASAGQVGDATARPARRDAGHDARHDDDAKLPKPARSPLVLGLGLSTAARCGPELTSPDGVEAQTCVMAQGPDTWARTYYRNATGSALEAVLSFMGPAGRTVQTHCAADADDEPATCETPRERARGSLDGYTAVTEFAAREGDGRLLLRSASNSENGSGSGSGSGSENGSGSGPGTGSGGSAGSPAGSLGDLSRE
ncbi:hypothetical protein ACGFZS_10470 [Streptomyces sp. NPDC048288]|uniref:hypothetical protein n=1 Tax=Streptomyces sp. NPDC048288 TaxID=3365529 RepID=UPI003724729E